MKTKILIPILALALYACGGETKQTSEAEEAATEIVESPEEATTMEADTLAVAESDSLVVEADSAAAPSQSSVE